MGINNRVSVGFTVGWHIPFCSTTGVDQDQKANVLKKFEIKALKLAFGSH